MRVSKDPSVRRQEIIDTAMRLFTQKGYEATSMGDIAKEMNVVKGLCYRYFESKQALFEEAMNHYVEECCKNFLMILKNHDEPFMKRMDKLLAMMSDKDIYRYHDLFHGEGNEALHEQLSLRMCNYMAPHVEAEIQYLCDEGILHIKEPSILTRFILFGQIGLLSIHDKNIDTIVSEIRSYVIKLCS